MSGAAERPSLTVVTPVHERNLPRVCASREGVPARRSRALRVRPGPGDQRGRCRAGCHCGAPATPLPVAGAPIGTGAVTTDREPATAEVATQRDRKIQTDLLSSSDSDIIPMASTLTCADQYQARQPLSRRIRLMTTTIIVAKITKPTIPVSTSTEMYVL